MTIKSGNPLDPADLRRRAEELLRGKPADLAAIPPEEAGRLLHELQVHQIELEMQNYELRRAQEEIERSRVKYLDLYDWAPMGYFTVGEKDLILEANYMTAELLGVERNQLLKQPLTRYILPEDKDIYYLHRKRLLETDVRQVFELRMCRQDGSPFWAWLVTDAAWDGKDGLPVYRTTVSDITERKRAEEEIRESSDRLRAIFQASPLPIVCLELDGTVKIWNRAAEVIFGWTEDEVVGHLLPFVPEDKMGEFHALLAQGHKGFLNGVEVRRRRKDGSPIDISIWASPLSDQKGNAVGIMAVIADITERKRSEEAHTRLSMAVDQASEGIVITDTEGRIEYVNPSFERITGYLQKEAVGQNMRILKSGKQDEMFYRNMWETISRGEVWRGHFINKKKDGTLYEEGTIISPVRNTSGKIINFVAGKRDITRDVMQQKQVQTAQRMESVGTLAGGIAHDFNNVLTVIIGYGEMLKLRIAYDPEAVSDLDEILREAERASVLTRQLLTFARRQVVEPVNLDLSEVMTDLVKLIRKVTREDIEIKTFPAECPVMIRADRGQVEQVLMNLCLNARDAMPEGGQLVIETRMTLLEEGYLKQYPYMKAGRYAVVSVSDTGVGMDEKTRERIFEPFFTTKGPDKGTGLGLAMVYGIVKQHNGFIHVFSEPGKGTTFRVYFPEVDAPADAKVIASQGVAHGGSETILLAEDNESVRHLTEQTLISYGYKVLIACDGEEALDIFRRHGKEIAMVVLDVVMPKKGGKQAYDEMIRTIPELKVLFLSGYSANAIHESFVLLPGLFFLQKPFGPDVLARKVREMLDRK